MFSNKQRFCQVCARPKKNHPVPFGKQCKLTPLTQEEKIKLLSELGKEETGSGEGSDDLNVEKDGSSDDAQLEALLAKEKQLIAAREAQLAQIAAQEKVLAEKKKKDMMAQVQARIEALSMAMEAEQAKLINIQSELSESPARTTTVPSATPATVPPISSITTPVLAAGHPVSAAVGSTTIPVYQSPVMSLATPLTGQAPPTPTFSPLAPTSQTMIWLVAHSATDLLSYPLRRHPGQPINKQRFWILHARSTWPRARVNTED